MGQTCLCHSLISSWTDGESWLRDVGPDTSDVGDRETQDSSRAPDWRLIWSNKVPADVAEHKIALCIKGDLASVTKGWSPKEIEARCRTVKVQVSPAGPLMTASLVDQDAEGVEISCLWWPEKKGCFATSADVTKLVESLVCLSSRNKDDKARIRHAVASYKSSVVSENRNREIFRLILSIGVPQDLKTRKTFKVLPWRFLEQVLGNILGGYRAVDRNSCPRST